MIRSSAHSFVALALIVGLTSGEAQARSLSKLPTRLDPAKAYVLVEIGQVDGTKAQGQITLARYAAGPGDVRGLGRAQAPAVAGAKPEKADPHETTIKQLVKDGPRRLYLFELEPDLWVVEGANGTAFSLGSATLQLASGSVTDLGVATVTHDFAEGEEPFKMTAGNLAKMTLLGGLLLGSAKPPPVPMAVTFRPRTARDLALPALFTAQVRAAEWSGPVKFGNYLGGLVNRMGGRKARPGAAPPSTGAAAPSSPAPQPQDAAAE